MWSRLPGSGTANVPWIPMLPSRFDIWKTLAAGFTVPLFALVLGYSLASNWVELLFIFGALPSLLPLALGLGESTSVIACSSILSFPVLLLPIILKMSGRQPHSFVFVGVFIYSSLCAALGLFLLAGRLI